MMNAGFVMRACLKCKKDISKTHLNRKYCSSNCYESSRYHKNGYRYTPEQRKEWYESRKKQDGYIQKLRDQGNSRAKKIKDFLAEYKMNLGCLDCGYRGHHSALEFDHIHGEKKINVCHAKSINQAKLEIEKCEVVCANCHRIRTYKRLYPCKADIFALTYEKV